MMSPTWKAAFQLAQKNFNFSEEIGLPIEITILANELFGKSMYARGNVYFEPDPTRVVKKGQSINQFSVLASRRGEPLTAFFTGAETRNPNQGPFDPKAENLVASIQKNGNRMTVSLYFPSRKRALRFRATGVGDAVVGAATLGQNQESASLKPRGRLSSYPVFVLTISSPIQDS